MTAHKVTQVDRELAADLEKLDCEGMETRWCRYMRAGKIDTDDKVQIIAAHRKAAEQSRDDVIEECAKVAEGYFGERSDSSHRASGTVLAREIRAMKGSKT